VTPHQRPVEVINQILWSSTVLAAENDDSELVCDSLRYVEPVQLGVQQPRQAPVELVGTGKDAGGNIQHSFKLVSRDRWCTTSNVTVVYLMRYKYRGSRAFPTAASSIWNSFPENVVSVSTLQSFQHHLKTFLFQRSLPDIVL